MSKNIIDDEYTVIENDIEKIQQKPTMYISYTGPEGVGHLAREITNNIIDEHLNPNTISDGKASIYHDYEENMTYFQDHGRGIAFDQLENMCTILQAGSKMNREYGQTAGENGVGMTATNALSEVFEITSTRNGRAKFLQFKEGKKVVDREIDVADKNKHGLLVAFKPSMYFLSQNAKLPVEEFKDWLQKQSFFLPKDLEIEFTCDKLPGKEASIHKVFKNTDGVSGYISTLMPEGNLLAKPIVLEASMPITEEDVPVRKEDGSIELVNIERTISLEVAINFNPKNQEPRFDAYCNNIENIQGGEHLNAVKSAISSFFVKSINEVKRKNDSLEYTANDVLAGICCVLNMRTDMSTKFESQTKHKLGNKLFYAPVRKLCTEALKKYFKLPENKKILNAVLDYVKFNAKLREDIANKRKTVKTSGKSFLDSKFELNCIANYVPANNISKASSNKHKMEVFVVEGDSAGGNVRLARANPDIQGVLALIGKCPNEYQSTSSKLGSMFKEVFDEILGCGYGNHFNMENLLYDKIVIDSDTDVDGDHICGLFLAAILKHAPKLIEEGHVYRCVVPLYRLEDKKRASKNSSIDKSLFLYHKSELFHIFEQNVSKKVRLKFNKDGDFVSSKNMERFLSTNRDYYKVLDTMSRHYSLHKDIIEFIANYPDTFKETISELGEELSYSKEDDCVSGIYKGEYYSIITDGMFMKKLKYLSDVIRIGNDGISSYHMYEKKGDEMVYCGYKSIGQIMEICQKFYPEIKSRYKGLGELNPKEMRDIAMNPENRVLIQFAIEDIEHTLKVFDTLFLDKHRPTRKKMVQESNLSEDDIDN